MKQRAKEVLMRVKKAYPDASCALIHNSALQLLVATILSAQCTDERVNKVTPPLFKRYKTARDFAEADILELEKLIHSTGFYHNKAKNIKGAAQKIVSDFNGKVPNNMDDLLTLPGVARKTANVVLGVWFKINAGIVVDTHVGRVSNRLGLSKHKTAPKIESDLVKLIPQPDWEYFSLAIIQLGRKICESRKPKCEICFLNDICPSAFKVLAKPTKLKVVGTKRKKAPIQKLSPKKQGRR